MDAPRLKPSTTTLAEALAAGVVVLDGGMSNQLEADGHDLSDELWSARLLLDEPEAIERVHEAYFAAGARVAITASYQATFEGFARKGIGRKQAAELLRRSVELARHARSVGVGLSATGGHGWARNMSAADGHRARGVEVAGAARHAQGAGMSAAGGHGSQGAELSAADGHRWIAASVGPYGAMLADGSEYRGRYGLSVAELERFHRGRIEALVAAGPDVLALETIPDMDEASALLRIVGTTGSSAWLSYSVSGGRTRAGQPLDEAFGLAASCPSIIAVGVNCCSPSGVEQAVEVAAAATGKPVVVYPNSGESWDASARAWQGPHTFDARLVRSWVSAGARLVGGCCRVGPAGIAAIVAALNPG